MNTHKLYAITVAAADPRGLSLYSKLFLVLAIIALMFATFPVAGVLAAPAAVTADDDLEQDWHNKLRNLQAFGLFYDQVRLYPADFENRDDLARAHDLLNRYGIALRQANTIVATRAGFDIKGNVTNERQAIETLNALGENLRIMRAIWTKFGEEGYKFHRLK